MRNTVRCLLLYPSWGLCLHSNVDSDWKHVSAATCCCWACPNMKGWKQYICLHSFTGVVEPAYWRHTSVYILEDNRTKGLLTQLFDIPPLCVENNKIFTQMPTTTTTTTPSPQHLHMTSHIPDIPHIPSGTKTEGELPFSLYWFITKIWYYFYDFTSPMIYV